MVSIIRVLNLNRETTAILENAYNLSYEREINAIWQASFCLPFNDPKVQKVELLRYVEIWDDDEYIGLFRIIPKLTTKNESTQEVREFGGNRVASRFWNTVNNNWNPWQRQAVYVGDANITVSTTIPARGTVNQTLSLGTINLDQVVSVQPEGTLENGLIPFAHVTSPGVITLKLNNITDNPITVNSQRFKIQRLQY